MENVKTKKRQKLFIFEIEITSAGKWWDSKKKEYIYSSGKKILIPVESNNFNNARKRLENAFSGSEYPSYKINHIHNTDEFLFDYKILQQDK